MEGQGSQEAGLRGSQAVPMPESRTGGSSGGRFWQDAGECVADRLRSPPRAGGELRSAGLSRAAAAAQGPLRSFWKLLAEASAVVWQKVEPRVADHMPEDRSPVWVFGVVILVLCLAVAGLRTDIHLLTSKEDNALPITAERVQLPDGRYIAYCEHGVPPDMARHSVLVVHDFLSSRLAGIPGIKEELLQEFGIRLVSYDRPGFGQSDPHPSSNLRTSAKDMAYIADALNMGGKFWVLGYSQGGIYCWAAAKHIPERLEGVAMFAPGGNIYSPNMTKEESRKIWEAFTLRKRLVYIIARRASSLLPSFYQRTILQSIDKYVSSLAATLGKKDQVLLDQEFFMESLNKDIRESIRQNNNAAALAQDTILQTTDWGFHLSDLRIRIRPAKPTGLLQWLKSFFQKPEENLYGFTGPIHMWQGTDDRLVPLAINDFAKRMVPQSVLHKLEGEGHFSYFCFCNNCHQEIFETLFGMPEGPLDIAATVQPLVSV